MNILVTGSSGVIGSYLIKKLIKEYPSAKIYGTTFKQFSTIGYTNNKNIHFIDYSLIFGIEQKFDQIWHLATYGQPAKFIQNWKDVLNLNTEDIIKLCRLLKPNGKFLYASSSEIYGSPGLNNDADMPASYTCTPRSIYIDSKRLGESIINSLLPKENYRIFRICLAYSPYFLKNDNRVLYEFIVKALSNNEIQLLDEGSAIRQYLFIKDACDMMLKITNTIYKNLLIKDEAPIFNISNSSEPITIYELAKLIGENLKVPIRKGPKNANPHSAPKIVQVYPERFLKLFPEFKFTSIKDGIAKVCSEAKQVYSKNI